MAPQLDQVGTPVGWRRPMVIWPLAWFLMGVGMMVGDVYSEPRHGPLWAALALGAVGWGAAGGYSGPCGPRNPATWRPSLGLAWALLFCAGLVAGMRSAELVEYALGGAGFEGLAAGLGVGGAVGGLLTGLSTAGAGQRRSAARGLGALALFGALFLLGAWTGTLGSYFMADLFEALLGWLVGDTVALTLGFGLGWAVGGLAAGAAATAVQAEPITG